MDLRLIWLCAFVLVGAPQGGPAEELKQGSMKKATERFNKALKKLARRDGYDMLGEVGSIKALKKKKIPDVTKEMVKLVSRD